MPEHNTPTRCPVCSRERVRPYYSGPGLDLYRCAGCALKFRWPVPSPEALAALYSEEYYDQTYPERILEEEKKLFLSRIDRLERLHGAPIKRVFEIGTGRGLFLAAARERGLDCAGQDVSRAAADHAEKISGVKVHCGPLETIDAAQGNFDLVHMNHVLEHIPDPLAALGRAGRLLRPGGLFYCEVPRQSNLLNRLSSLMAGGDFGFTYFPGHLYLFSRDSLGRLFDQAGFDVLESGIEGMAAPHRFVRGVHYASPVAHLVKLVAGGLRLERVLGGGNLYVAARKPG